MFKQSKINRRKRHCIYIYVFLGNVMSVKEMKLNICGVEMDMFFYDVFFSSNGAPSPFHSHDYAEVHFTVSGECSIYTDKEELSSKAGTVTIIPRGVIHRLKMADTQTVHKTFFINCDLEEILRKQFPEEVLCTLSEDAEQFLKTGDFDKAAISVAYICKDILRIGVRLSELENREFMIREFFADRYSEDITLSDLSSELGLSKKHTSRLVEKYMGASFSSVLAMHRIFAANLLMKTDKALTLAEIAETVGYESYSGFWKAFRKNSVSISE